MGITSRSRRLNKKQKVGLAGRDRYIAGVFAKTL